MFRSGPMHRHRTSIVCAVRAHRSGWAHVCHAAEPIITQPRHISAVRATFYPIRFRLEREHDFFFLCAGSLSMRGDTFRIGEKMKILRFISIFQWLGYLVRICDFNTFFLFFARRSERARNNSFMNRFRRTENCRRQKHRIPSQLLLCSRAFQEFGDSSVLDRTRMYTTRTWSRTDDERRRVKTIQRFWNDKNATATASGLRNHKTTNARETRRLGLKREKDTNHVTNNFNLIHLLQRQRERAHTHIASDVHICSMNTRARFYARLVVARTRVNEEFQPSQLEFIPHVQRSLYVYAISSIFAANSDEWRQHMYRFGWCYCVKSGWRRVSSDGENMYSSHLVSPAVNKLIESIFIQIYSVRIDFTWNRSHIESITLQFVLSHRSHHIIERTLTIINSNFHFRLMRLRRCGGAVSRVILNWTSICLRLLNLH